jgi:hypothetical protein
MRILSKSKLLSYRQCSKRLWLEVHRPDLCEASTATKAVFKVGRHVGEIARRLYDPKEQGALVEVQKKGFKAALCRSTKLLSSSKPIIEAGFASGGAIGRSSGSPTQLFYWPYTNKSYPKAAFFRVCGFQKRELERYAVKPRRIAKNALRRPQRLLCPCRCRTPIKRGSISFAMRQIVSVHTTTMNHAMTSMTAIAIGVSEIRRAPKLTAC